VLARLVQSGASVLIVLHETGALTGLIDRAVVLRDGRVVHDGALGGLAASSYHGHEIDQPVQRLGVLNGPVER
jgi:zinc transport system ATP-binding protein